MITHTLVYPVVIAFDVLLQILMDCLIQNRIDQSMAFDRLTALAMLPEAYDKFKGHPEYFSFAAQLVVDKEADSVIASCCSPARSSGKIIFIENEKLKQHYIPRNCMLDYSFSISFSY
jgi:hypothetical protein